mgnify:CR=1 FL=1
MIVLRLLTWVLDGIEFLVSPFGFFGVVISIFYGATLLRPELEVLFVEVLIAISLMGLYRILNGFAD